MHPPQCKNNIQKFLKKLNYLRQFISNLSEKISAFAPIFQLKNKVEFIWGGGGADQHRTFEDFKKYLSSPSLPVSYFGYTSLPKRPCLGLF
jgi:hypothetical protein